MPVLLTVIPTTAIPWHFLLWEDAPGFEFGRARGNDIWIDEVQVSRRHGRIEYRGPEGWWIVDHGSANGVAIDGERVDEARLVGVTEVRIADLLCRAILLTREELLALHQGRLDVFQRELQESQSATELEATELLDRLLRSCARVCGASRGFVLLGRSADRLRLRASLNIDASALAEAHFSGSRSVVERVFASGEAVVAADTSQDAFLTDQDSIRVGRIRSVICFPLHGLESQLGVLYLDSQEQGKVFDALDLEFLESLAGQTALALRVDTLRDDLKQIRRQAEREGALGDARSISVPSTPLTLTDR